MSQLARDEQRDQSAPARRQRPRWLLLTLLCLAQFMVILDVTVVNVALPDIGRSLHLGREVLTWVVAAYTLTLGGLLILGGRLADALGRRTVFLAGLALFTVASLTAGLAGNGTTLLSSRIAQGVGAALLSPSALSILTVEFTGPYRNRALGVWGAIGGGGAAVGVLVGGALTAGPGWQWVFYLNVPVGLLVGLAVPAVVPARPVAGRTGMDVPGALVGVITVVLLIFGVIRAGDAGFGSWTVLVPIGVAILGVVGFVLLERRVTAPLVPPALLSRPPLPGAVVLMLGATALLLSTFFLSSLYLQNLRHESPLRTGLVFLPVALATMVGAHLSATLVGRAGPRVLAAVGLAVAAAGLAPLAWLGTGGAVILRLLPGFVVAAAGLGAAFVTATTSGLAGLDERHAGVGSGILNTGHELGGSLGIALMSTIAAPSLSGAMVAVGFHRAYLTAAVGALVLAAAALFILPRGLAVGSGPVRLH